MYIQCCWAVTPLVPRGTAAVWSNSVYTIQLCIVSRHFMQIHIRKTHACLAVTCHLHFWQNDRDRLRATAVTLDRNEYRNKSQHRKLTPEKTIHLPLLPELEPAIFPSRDRPTNLWAIPTPHSNRSGQYQTSSFFNSRVRSSCKIVLGNGLLRTQKLWFSPWEKPDLTNVLRWKLGVCQNNYSHARFAHRVYFLS